MLLLTQIERKTNKKKNQNQKTISGTCFFDFCLDLGLDIEGKTNIFKEIISKNKKKVIKIKNFYNQYKEVKNSRIFVFVDIKTI